MPTIQLTDQAARIAKITPHPHGDTIELEWGGPDDRDVCDFDLARLGRVQSHGGNLTGGWVKLSFDHCQLPVGATIPHLCPRYRVSITQHGNLIQPEGAQSFAYPAAAIAWAQKYARQNRNHVDFQDMDIEVWRHDGPDHGECVHTETIGRGHR